MGRRRRTGVREANGRARREHNKDFAPTKIKRAIDDAMQGYGNALFGSVLGQLSIRHPELIEPYHVAAGQKYAGLALKYHAATGAPPFSRSANLQLGLHANQPDVDSPLGHELSLTERSVIERMHKVEQVLLALGRPTVLAVRDACERDIDPGPFHYDDLRAGLHQIAQMFNLTPTGKNVR
jgi:hypothetical protein